MTGKGLTGKGPQQDMAAWWCRRSEWLTKHRGVTRRATSCAREVRDALDFGIVSRQQEMGRGPCVERPDESMVDGEMDGILDRLGTNA